MRQSGTDRMCGGTSIFRFIKQQQQQRPMRMVTGHNMNMKRHDAIESRSGSNSIGSCVAAGIAKAETSDARSDQVIQASNGPRARVRASLILISIGSHHPKVVACTRHDINACLRSSPRFETFILPVIPIDDRAIVRSSLA